MTAFEDFVNTELPRRPAQLNQTITGYDGDPNDGGAPAILQGAPAGTNFLQATGNVYWRKRTTVADSWEQNDSIGPWAEVVGDDLYVGGVGADDSNPGTQAKPFETMAAAIAEAAVIQAAAPTQPVIIHVATGTYAENIVIENSDLRNLTIVGAVEDPRAVSSVTFQSLQSTVNNEELRTLRIIGIRFNSPSELSCPTTGSSNNFLYSLGLLFNCYFRSGGLTVQSANFLWTYASTFQGLTLRNVYSVVMQEGGWIYVPTYDFIIDADDTEAVPNLMDSVNQMQIEMRRGVRVLNPKSISITKTSWSGALNVYVFDGCQFTSNGTFTLGAGALLSLVRAWGSTGDTATINGQFYITQSGFEPYGMAVSSGGELGLTGFDAYVYAWGAVSTIASGATLYLWGGVLWNPWDYWTIDAGANVYFDPAEAREDVENLVHVSPKYGHDKYNGSQRYPVATIAAAIAKVVAIQTADSTKMVRVVVGIGTYAEPLTLENVNLHQLEVEAELDDTNSLGVIIQRITSAQDNENLEYLQISNIKFTAASTISCDVDGANNHLGDTGLNFKNCRFAGVTTLEACYIAWFKDCYFPQNISITNCGRVDFDACSQVQPGKKLIGIIDALANKNNNWYGYQVIYPYGESVLSAPDMSVINGDTGWIGVGIWTGSSIGATTEVGTFGDQTWVDLYVGAYLYGSAGSSFSSGSWVDFYGGILSSDYTIDPAATIAIDEGPTGPAAQRDDIIYVDGNLGHAGYNGSEKYPYKTIGDAITRAIAIQTADPTQHTQILVSSGAYAENLVLENTNLVSLELQAISEGSGTESRRVEMLNLTSTQDNENLEFLKIAGFEFTGDVNLSSDVAGSDFGSEEIVFDNCLFSKATGTFTLYSVNVIRFTNGCYVNQPAFNFTNCWNIIFEFRSLMRGTGSIVGVADESSLKPSGWTDITCGIVCSTGSALPSINLDTQNGSTVWIGGFCYGGRIGNQGGATDSYFGAYGWLAVEEGGQFTEYNGNAVADAGSWIDVTGGRIDFSEFSSIDSSSYIYIDEGGLGSQRDDVIFVDAARGHDLFNGSEKYPYATIATAITRAIAIQTADSAQRVTIEVASGTYTETLDFSDTNLHKLDLTAAAVDVGLPFRPRPVSVTGINTTADNENLDLTITGFVFTGDVTYSCDVAGASNDSYLSFHKCQFAALQDATFGSLILLTFDDCRLNTEALAITNVFETRVTNTVIAGVGSGTRTWDWDDTGVIPDVFTSGRIRVENSSILSAITLARSGTTGGIDLMCYGGAQISPVGITVQAGCALSLNTGSYLYSYTNADDFQSGSTLNLWGGVLFDNPAGRTLSGTINYEAPYYTDKVILNDRLEFINGARFVNAVNDDVDTGTEDVDTFADTLGEGVDWDYVVKKGANTRKGTVSAGWESSTDTITHTETGVEVGDTSDLTFDVDINSNTVRLRATATSDNWEVRVVRRLV